MGFYACGIRSFKQTGLFLIFFLLRCVLDRTLLTYSVNCGIQRKGCKVGSLQVHLWSLRRLFNFWRSLCRCGLLGVSRLRGLGFTAIAPATFTKAAEYTCQCLVVCSSIPPVVSIIAPNIGALIIRIGFSAHYTIIIKRNPPKTVLVIT